jgi:hypothetical protein
MKFTGKDGDVRGQRWNFQDNENLISLFEIKKGFSRGGQYHENEVTHVLISGKIEYRKENVLTGKEEISTLDSFSSTLLPPNTSDLITALEDSVMVGIYKNEPEKKYYEKHSRIVKEKMELEKNHEHFVNDDPTKFPKEDMEDLVKKAVKKFKSL